MQQTSNIWPGTTEEALSVVHAGLRISGVPLRSNDIPLLPQSVWHLLDARITSEKPKMQTGDERGAELLCWIRGLAVFIGKERPLGDRAGRHLIAALAYGTYTNTFVALSEMAEALGLDDTVVSEQVDYPAWLDHRCKLARLYKRQGKFLRAIELTARLAGTLPSSLDATWRTIAQGKILLHVAKAACSQDMRIGMGLVLSRLSTQRFREVVGTKERRNPRYGAMLARAIDTQMGIEFDFLVASAGTAQAIAPELQQSLFRRWQEAMDLDDEFSNASSRTAFRQCRARFDCEELLDEREVLRVQFRTLLSKMPTQDGDARGQAIREGQYAEMLTRTEHFETAEHYLQSAVTHSRRVCDWTTASLNLWQLANLRGQQLHRGEAAAEEALELITDAKAMLAHLEEQPTTQHLGLCKTQANLCQLIGDWEGARSALEEAGSHLEKTLKRLNTESARLLLSDGSTTALMNSRQRTYAPTAILSIEECGLVVESLAADWNIVTSAQRDLMRQLATAGSFVQRSSVQQMSWRRLVRYGATIIHRVKNNYVGSFTAVKEKVRTHPECPTSLKVELTQAIDQSAQQLVESLSKELRINPDARDAEIEFHSVIYLAGLSEAALRDLRTVVPDLDYHVESVGGSDFRISGFVPEIQIHLFPFYENAARVLGQVGSAVARKTIRSRVSWTAQPSDVDMGGNDAYGCLEIEDAGGRLKELQEAVEAVRIDRPADKWHGLDMAISFLRDEYKCTITTSGLEGQHSTVRIIFPIGARVVCA